MKQYPEIMGPRKAPHASCIAFEKYDGSNLRFEWSKKQGWYKFGTRRRLFDETDESFGPAISLFMDSIANELDHIFRQHKHFRNRDQCVVFCEYFGPQSFAGLHDPNDTMTLRIIDVAIHKKGIILPKDFLKLFNGLPIARMVYQGNFGPQLVKDVMDGKYNVEEGIVAKGVKPGSKNPQHRFWMAKVKTRTWMEKLKEKAIIFGNLRKELEDTMREQDYS